MRLMGLRELRRERGSCPSAADDLGVVARCGRRLDLSLLARHCGNRSMARTAFAIANVLAVTVPDVFESLHLGRKRAEPRSEAHPQGGHDRRPRDEIEAADSVDGTPAEGPAARGIVRSRMRQAAAAPKSIVEWTKTRRSARSAHSCRRSAATTLRRNSPTTSAGFKQQIETGEVVRSDAVPEGHLLAEHLKQRAGPAPGGGSSMKATCWMGRNSVEVQNVPDPKILNERDAIVRITSTAICGSDLHLVDGYVPTMKRGDIMGHEFMGEVVEKGRGVGNLKVGDRVVVPFPIACGACLACERAVTRSARTRTRTHASPRRCSASRPRASSGTRISPAASQAARRSTSACRSPTSAR